MRPTVSVEQLAAATGLSRGAIRYHCRDPRGALYGVAVMEGKTWRIPAAAAARYVRDHQERPDPGTALTRARADRPAPPERPSRTEWIEP